MPWFLPHLAIHVVTSFNGIFKIFVRWQCQKDKKDKELNDSGEWETGSDLWNCEMATELNRGCSRPRSTWIEEGNADQGGAGIHGKTMHRAETYGKKYVIKMT